MLSQLLSFQGPSSSVMLPRCSSGVKQGAEALVSEPRTTAGRGNHTQCWELAAFLTTAEETPQSWKITHLCQRIHLLLTISTKVILLILVLKMHNLHAEQLIVSLRTSKNNYKVTLYNFQSSELQKRQKSAYMQHRIPLFRTEMPPQSYYTAHTWVSVSIWIGPCSG